MWPKHIWRGQPQNMLPNNSSQTMKNSISFAVHQLKSRTELLCHYQRYTLHLTNDVINTIDSRYLNTIKIGILGAYEWRFPHKHSRQQFGGFICAQRTCLLYLLYVCVCESVCVCFHLEKWQTRVTGNGGEKRIRLRFRVANTSCATVCHDKFVK